MWICWPTRHFIHLRKLKGEFGYYRGQNVVLEKFWGQSAVLNIFGSKCNFRKVLGQNTILEKFLSSKWKFLGNFYD